MARPGLHPVAGAWTAFLRDQIVSIKIKAAALEAVELKNAACLRAISAVLMPSGTHVQNLRFTSLLQLLTIVT